MTSDNEHPPSDTSEGDLLLAAEAAQAEADAAAAVAEAAKARARAAQLRLRAGSARTRSAGVSQPEGKTASAEKTQPGNGTAAAKAGVASDDSKVGEADVSAEDETRLRRWRVRPVPRIRRHTAGMVVAAVLLCAGVGGSGFVMWRHHDVTEKQHREAEFVAAARQGVTSLTSLDYNHAADDVKRVIDDSTGSFRDDFKTRADDFAKVIQQSKVATEGKVNAAAVQSMTDDSAVVLVSATSRVTNSAGAKQEPRAWRLSVTVERVDGQLKMSKVEFVP